jgi:hypothetical protein
MTSPDYLDTVPPLQNPTTASPWVPLWRIIEQIASAIEDNREAEHYAKTRRYIRQAAVEGRLRIRGRHEIEVVGQDRTIFSEIHTEIPPAYWKSSVIDGLATDASFEAVRHTSPEKTPCAWGPRGLYEPNCYTGLQLNSDDLSQLIGDIRGTGLLADTRSISTETEALKFSDVVSLKPTLWGMSIDLLKVWKWLREQLHSLGRKQPAMPQFPKTGSILSRLWRDPVWSKVIATGITAGIGALAVWYFHIQNPPPPATTHAPAIPAAPQSRPTPTTPPSVTQVPSGPNLSPADRATNLDIWHSVNEDCHSDFANAINNLYGLLHDWPQKISSNRNVFVTGLTDIQQQLRSASTCLEKLREEYPGYKDISQILTQPYTSLTLNAIEKFARAINDLPQALPTDFRVGLRPDAGELQVALTDLQNWDGDVSRIANLKINELSGRR